MNDLFRELEKTTNTGCWKFDLLAEKLTWSEQTYLIHGVTPNTIIDVKTAIDFYHPNDRETITKHFQECINNKTPYRVYLRIIDTQGMVKPVEAMGKPLIENDKVVAVFGTFRDLSKEVHILNSKNEVKNQLRNYKSSINQFLIIAETDAEGTITSVNDKFCEISQYSEEELIGKNHRLINSGHHSKDFFKQMWTTLQKGNSWEGQICNKAKDGTQYWVQTFIFPDLNSDMEILGYTAIRFDITEKKRLEIALSEEKEKATFTSQLATIGEMSAGIAHEISNPLSVIIGNTNMIQNVSNITEQTKQMATKIEYAANRINKIIKGLKNLARKSKDDSMQEYKLSDILVTTFEFCEEVFKHKGIQLDVNIPSKPIFLLGNDIKLSQIFLNILNNAKDAILESGTSEKWIKIDIKENHDVVEIDIIDSGPGVPEESKDKILDAFYTTKPAGKGTGLGLALVKSFLDEHRGKIELCYDYSNTCFRVTLPLIKK